jgi:uncharacterized protein with HEPN domain
MADDRATVLDIVLACRRLQRFIASIDEKHFQADEEKRWASVSQLLIVGEATTRLSREFREAHPTIRWTQIAGMRNRLIHGYDKIKWPLVWRTTREDIPELLRELEGLVQPPNDLAPA